MPLCFTSRKSFLIFLSTAVLVALLGCDIYKLLYPTAAIVVTNNSDLPVVEIYIALSDAPDWGENRLVEALPSGHSIRIDGLPRNVAKVRLLFSNGVEKVLEGINLRATEIYDIEVVFEQEE